MKTEQNIKLGQVTAIASFILGTIIFGLYYLTSAFELLFIGYGYIVLTGLANFGVLIIIIRQVNSDKENRKRLLKICGLMTLNIPVMIFYSWVALILIGNMRITFTNLTQNTITNINIIGCESEYIDKLAPGKGKTVWVAITGDCTINIDYLSNGLRKEENVFGYVTHGMGQKINYNIGGQNEKDFY